MKTLPPKEHPTFKRAMELAHRRLMNERSKLNTRVDELVAQGVADAKEAGSIALAEMAQLAYEDAVETLASECSRRARVEYTMTGEAYVDDALAQISRHGKSSALISKALKSARKAMPEQVRCVHEFGLREDGLIFGLTRNVAVNGSFEALQSKVRKAMEQAALREAKAKIKLDGAPDEMVDELAPRLLAAMAPALRQVAERSFPSDKAAQSGRPLCARAADLAEKISGLEEVVISCDNEPRHAITGMQAKVRLLSLSGEADSERPDAGSLSAFFLKLGV